MEPSSSLAVANYFLTIARRNGTALSLMQLIKLVYLAHGWSLALGTRRPLCSTLPQAWQYGPVFPEIYSKFKKFRSAPITELAIDPSTGRDYRAEFSAEEITLMDSVFQSYGHMHAFQLSNLMHQSGTPWTTVYNNSGPYSQIPNAIIANHFDELRKQRQNA